MAIKNRQFRDTGNTRNTRHWQHQAYKTLATPGIQDTGGRQTKTQHRKLKKMSKNRGRTTGKNYIL